MTTFEDVPNRRRDVFVGAAAALFEAGWHRAVARALGPRHPDGARETIDDRLVRRWVAGVRPIPGWVFRALAEIVESRTISMEIQARELSIFLIRLRKEANAAGGDDGFSNDKFRAGF